MKASIREFEPSDEEPVVGLSLRARQPVFAAVEEMLGSELFARLRGEPNEDPDGPHPGSRRSHSA